MDNYGNEEWELFNRTNKEIDDIYHQFAVKNSMSDSVFWIFYNLYIKTECTQKDICSDWQFSKQTINSAIKDLENKNYIELKYKENNKKNKIISITEKGKEYADKAILKIIEIEKNVYKKTDKEEFNKAIHFFQEQAILLKEEIEKDGGIK